MGWGKEPPVGITADVLQISCRSVLGKNVLYVEAEGLRRKLSFLKFLCPHFLNNLELQTPAISFGRLGV